MTKSIKKLDFMYYAPYELGIDFLVSKKIVDIISAYKLPIHNKIPVKIDTFDGNYFLIGFPVWSFEVLDFQKSTFYHRDRDVFSFIDYEDYENSESKYRYTTKVDLYLKEKIEYDVISIGAAIFFSEKIVEELKENNATGYRIVDGILNIWYLPNIELANEFLSDTLGQDWEDIISSGENLHRHYAPLPEEEELTDIPLESTEG